MGYKIIVLSEEILYNLINGDCLNEMDKLISNGVKVDMILTDPPYKTITGGDSDGKNSVRPKGMLSGNRKLFTHQTTCSPKDWMPKLFSILNDGSHAYIFTNALNLKEMLDVSISVGFQMHNLLVWEKNNCTPSQFYMKNCEYVLFLRKGKAKWINNIGKSKTVHQFDNIIGHKVHPCEKPIDLLKFYIENSTTSESLILDPFMGSGSTGVACVDTNRNFIGIELDEGYYQIAKDRMNNA